MSCIVCEAVHTEITRERAMRVERELMRGAGPVAVLKLLDAGEMYGYELVEGSTAIRAVCWRWGSRRSIRCSTIWKPRD